MNVRRFEPLGDVNDLFDEMFRGFFVRPVMSNDVSGGARNAQGRVRIDVTEQEKNYQVQAELPGLRKEDIQVTVDGDVVTISAQSKSESERKEGDRVLYRERSVGQVSRSFRLGAEIDLESAQAKYENGVLELTLPKKPANAAKQLAVQ